MASTANLRSRRSAAQLHALAGVEREIRSMDSSSRRKYLRDFSQAYCSYQSVLTPQQITAELGSADTILIGDYHALATSQQFAARLLEDRAQPGDRPIVLGVETIFSRDQHIVNEWWRREIDEEEFRQRIRFDLDWGYDWTPFYQLLSAARENAEAIYGLDCMPREDLRKIGARDRHAAHKISEIRQRHPNAVILVLFGESHLAPDHLPRQLSQHLPGERVLTVLQNVDALYWHAAGEACDRVEAVQVRDDVVCVFNSTPLEKYESYRLHLSRWGRTDAEGPDLGPTIYNLIDSLIRFLEINRYSSHNGTQPKFLVDLLPEVYGPTSGARLGRLLTRSNPREGVLANMLRNVEERGSVYLPQVNAFYVHEFQMAYAAEEAARFLHHACRGLPKRVAQEHTRPVADRFYARTLENALAYFGSRILYPARPAGSEQARQPLPRTAPDYRRKKFDASAQVLGYMLGSSLYEAYLEGSVSTATIRRLFLTHIEQPGRAKQTYFELATKLNATRKKAKS
jgi:heme-binding uptake protein ChaN (Tiki superfamily)